MSTTTTGVPVVSLARWRSPAAIVPRASGLAYRVHVGGHAARERIVEGWLVPVDGAEGVAGFFARFQGWPPESGAEWGRSDVAALRGALQGVRVFDAPVSLDEARQAELTEAWVPVVTRLGPGYLVTENAG